jgi:hypothetical protein
VARGAGGARDLPVADVPYEHVPEAVLVLAFHRAGARRADELFAGQLVQRLLDPSRVPIAHPGECACPKHLAQHRGVLKQALPLRGQGVEACGDQCLHRLRRIHPLTDLAALREQTHELLRVQGVAACAFQ